MTTLNSSNDSNQNNKSIEYVLHLLFFHLKTMWSNAVVKGNIFLYRIGAYEVFNKIALLSSKHPYLALIVSIIITTIMLPFLIIFGFALSTILLTFTGFILIEGTLITIVSVLLFGCLVGLVVVLLFLGVLVLASYLGFMHVFDLYNAVKDNAVTNFLNKETSNIKS